MQNAFAQFLNGLLNDEESVAARVFLSCQLVIRYYVSSLPSDAVSAKRFQESFFAIGRQRIACIGRRTRKVQHRQTRFSECGVGGGLDVSDGNGWSSCVCLAKKYLTLREVREQLSAKPQNARQI
jgi:hypothetical protein